MTSNRLPSPLRGVIPPLITPLRDRSTLDADGLDRLIEHVIAGGVHGLFILGTTGEAPSLDSDLKRELVRRTCATTSGRVPVLVGISETAFTESLKIAEYAHACGAKGLVLAPPYYFPTGQPELLEYVEHLAPLLPLPVFLYNKPFNPQPVFDPQTVRRTLEIPGIVGLKDSSANMVYFHKLLSIVSARSDFSLLMGPEELLADAVLFGGHGGVCGGANLFPRLYVSLFEAAARGDLSEMRRLQRCVLDVGEAIYSVGRHASSGIKGLKGCLALKGICHDFMADPFHRFRKEDQDVLATRLQRLESLAQ